MKPVKIWRVEDSIRSCLGVLAICDSESGIASVYVLDGTTGKRIEELQSFAVTEKAVTICGKTWQTVFPIISEIPISEGTDRVSLTIVAAKVYPGARS